MNSKVEFSEKLRNSFDKRGYEKLAAKVGMFFSTRSCQQFSQKKRIKQGTLGLSIPRNCKQMTRWWGGGGQGGGAGI